MGRTVQVHVGAEAIARRLGLVPKQVYRLVENGHAPFIVRLGRKLVAREVAITTWFETQEGTKSK